MCTYIPRVYIEYFYIVDIQMMTLLALVNMVQESHMSDLEESMNIVEFIQEGISNAVQVTSCYVNLMRYYQLV